MIYGRYEDYTESGLQWLGVIPSHWNIVQSRRLFGQRKERARQGDEQLTASQKYGIISQKKFMSLENQRVVQVLTGSEILKHIEPNDFVISMRSFQGGLEWCKQPGCVSSAYIGLIPIKHVVPEFFSYLFKCKPYIQALQSTSNLVRDGQALRFDNFSQVWLPIIPDVEQQNIANFLDYETAKIDTLIKKQQQLIKLLKEKRQAVISHAVTKGLNPEAPMRDSGIEWLGDVPEHWVNCTLRHYADFEDGDRGSEYPNDKDFKDDGVVFLSSKNIIEESLDLSEVKFISLAKFNALNRGKALDGDLIVKVRGSTGRIGELAKFQTSEHGYKTAFINAQMMIIRTRKGLQTDYLRLIAQSLYWTEQLAVGAYGTAQQQLSNDVFAKLFLTLPPTDEQSEIIEMLGLNLLTFNGLISKAQKAISLMQERRTALISASVTGKIDVRNWQRSAYSNNQTKETMT